jgi:hypothetical protein
MYVSISMPRSVHVYTCTNSITRDQRGIYCFLLYHSTTACFYLPPKSPTSYTTYYAIATAVALIKNTICLHTFEARRLKLSPRDDNCRTCCVSSSTLTSHKAKPLMQLNTNTANKLNSSSFAACSNVTLTLTRFFILNFFLYNWGYG